ncbi:MAG: transaldolase [Anaerolineales bacterium]|jgi:transaldolase
MNPIQHLHTLGQSVWLDYIRLDLLRSGKLARMVADGEVRGVTSNPTIFEQAISTGDEYNPAMRPMAVADWSEERIFDALALDDIREASIVLLPLYEATNGNDGYVSLEVSPYLANDSEGTLQEARRLWSTVNRPNVMIKIPATEAGIPAIEQAILEGINVNVTLIFSLQRYAEVIDAYLRGLEGRLKRDQSLVHIASVASFFVSRVDTKVDGLLDTISLKETETVPRATALRGKIAIANAKLAYVQFKDVFASQRFERLKLHGARLQRPLWASTSTKDPAYPDTYYVDNLIGEHTVNTLPPKTLSAFREHGKAEPTLERNLSDARGQVEALESLGISMEKVTDELEEEGVNKFAESYTSVLKTIAERARSLREE